MEYESGNFEEHNRDRAMSALVRECAGRVVGNCVEVGSVHEAIKVVRRFRVSFKAYRLSSEGVHKFLIEFF